jgi:hypothetical protein
MIELLHNLLGLGLQDTKLREHLFILQVAHHFHGQNRILGLSRSAGNQEELRARSANYSINTQEVYIRNPSAIYGPDKETLPSNTGQNLSLGAWPSARKWVAPSPAA